MSTPFKAYSGEKPYAFVSYSHMDSGKVYPIIQRLIQEGYRIWFDEGITPSHEWRGVINQKVRDCSMFIVFVSMASMASDEVQREATFAINMDKPLHIIYLEEVPNGDIPNSLLADFVNNQCVYAYRMHSTELHEKLRAPLTPFLEEKHEAESTSQTPKAAEKNITNDLQLDVVKTWQAVGMKTGRWLGPTLTALAAAAAAGVLSMRNCSRLDAMTTIEYGAYMFGIVLVPFTLLAVIALMLSVSICRQGSLSASKIESYGLNASAVYNETIRRCNSAAWITGVLLAVWCLRTLIVSAADINALFPSNVPAITVWTVLQVSCVLSVLASVPLLVVQILAHVELRHILQGGQTKIALFCGTAKCLKAMLTAQLVFQTLFVLCYAVLAAANASLDFDIMFVIAAISEGALLTGMMTVRYFETKAIEMGTELLLMNGQELPETGKQKKARREKQKADNYRFSYKK